MAIFDAVIIGDQWMFKRKKKLAQKKMTPKGFKKTALGRGLDALIPDIETIDTKPNDYFLCDVDLIRPNRYQPRQTFSEEEMAELCDSIKSQGVLQPLLVRKIETGYELIAGERRLRASKMANLTQVPVLVKQISDTELMEISIVENIQRENLNPIEEANAYHRLMAEFQLKQEEVAKRVGKSRSAVANFLRLRQLEDFIKESIAVGEISMGHARALLGLDSKDSQKEVWKTILKKKLSVRETEALVNRLKKVKHPPVTPQPTSEQIYYANLSDELARHLGTKVRIQHKGKRGRLEIEFYNTDDLDRLITRIKVQN